MKHTMKSYSNSISVSASYASLSLWPTAVTRQAIGASGVRAKQQPQTPATKKEKLTKLLHIGLILVVILCFGMLFSLFAPFFPAEADKKGMPPTVVGLLFGCYELIVFLLTPVWGILAPKIGFRFMTACGMLLSGGATILFGFLDQSPEGSIYIIMCFSCRVVEALGVSMYITASFAYGSTLYPDDVAFIYGLLETFNGAGFMLGPPLGGVLYKIGGFFLPFLTIGALILVLGSISALLLKSANEEASTNSISIWVLFKMPLVIVLAISEVVCAMIFAFLDPTLSIFLIGLGISDPVLIGAMFMVCSIAYTVACLFTGKAVEWWDSSYTFMMLGAALTCIGYLLIGPSPLIPLYSPNITTIIISCLIGFVGLGFIVIPFPKILTDHLLEQGFPADIETNALVSGVYNCVWYMGSFIGPSSAGAMVEGIGFLWSSTIMAMLAAAVFVLLVVTVIVVRSEKAKTRGQYRYAIFRKAESVSSSSSSGDSSEGHVSLVEEEEDGSSDDSEDSAEEAGEERPRSEKSDLLDSGGNLSGSSKRWHSASYGAVHRTNNQNLITNESV